MSLILIVDDHRDTCRVVSRLVRTLGWQAEVAETGQAALEFLGGGGPRPDVVLLDVTMPGMDGFETLRRMREIPDAADIPVVMMSAIAGEEDQRRAAALGAAEYWIKGAFDPASLAESLARVALRRRSGGGGGDAPPPPEKDRGAPKGP